MTLEEKLKVCSICKNRKHSIKEGLVCGKTDAKPAFADDCPDFDIDIAEQKRLKKNAAEVAEADHRRSAGYTYFAGSSCRLLPVLDIFKGNQQADAKGRTQAYQTK